MHSIIFRTRTDVQTQKITISNISTAQEMNTYLKEEYGKCIDSSSETLTASETELIHMLVTGKETDSLSNSQKKK